MARAAVEHAVFDFFRKEAKSLRARLTAAVHGVLKALRKDEDPDVERRIEEAVLAIEWYELVYPLESALYEAGLSGITKGLAQISVTDNATITEYQQLARDYAQDRAAEMVGLKWVDGELVENPDARWAISETTRETIRELVTQAFSQETPIADLEQAIDESGIFSEARSKMIAKTEVARAQSRGILSAWQATGAVVSAKWVLSSIHKCCDECDANAAAGPVKVGEQYPSGETEPPAHPNCNCALVAVEVAAS